MRVEVRCLLQALLARWRCRSLRDGPRARRIGGDSSEGRRGLQAQWACKRRGTQSATPSIEGTSGTRNGMTLMVTANDVRGLMLAKPPAILKATKVR